MMTKDRIKWNKTTGLILALMILLFTADGLPQYFGKNKVQYKEFDWKFIQSQHFDVFYYGDGLKLAEFVADEAESSYVSLQENFRYILQKRVPILVYNSHNDFEQTNATYSILTESVEGFTEILKDRVVIQFRGSYKDFRNLTHHELTHAVMLQMLYGRGVGSMVMGMARFQVPLWLAEGLAEYASIGWDSESDMYIRDATINGYIPPIAQMYGFMNYKGGQSLLNYLAEKYGKPKIGEILSKVRSHRNVEEGLKKSIGIGLEELTKQWHKYLRKVYWPDIEDRDEPEDIGKRLTDHVKNRHFLNNSPSLSPKGDKIVYMSNRSDYMDLYLMSAIDGKNLGRLVKGERSQLFEELHWPRPGIDWSPNGEKIVFAAKAGAEDALFILNVDQRKVEETIRLDIDGIFSPSWSPKGDLIVFIGIDAGQSDIYVFDLGEKKLRKLTDDIFSDLDAKWSPDGNEIVFVSDRGDYLQKIPPGIKMQPHQFSRIDVYEIQVGSGEIIRLTDDEAEEFSPAYSPDGDKIAYASDRNGISNIYILDKAKQESYPITNLLTGVSQFSWSREGSRLAFASFYNGGFDIYVLNNPLEIKPGSIVLRDASFLEKRKKEMGKQLTEKVEPEVTESEETSNYRNFVFGEAFRKGKMDAAKKGEETFLDTTQYKDAAGEYHTKKYKIRFTPDVVSGAAGYNQFYGLQGSSMIMLSDILGNHQISIYSDLFYNLKNSNFQLGYTYLPKRTDMGVSIFHYSYLWYTYFADQFGYYPGYIQDRYYGFTLFMSRPFSRFARLQWGMTGLGIDRDYGELDYWGYTGEFMHELGNIYKRRILMINLGYTTDTVLWGMTGPVNGARSSFTASYSPNISKSYGLDYWTFRGDWRKYYRIKRDYTMVVRLAGGLSGGESPQRFLLGGMPGWVNYKYHEISTEDWGDDLFYFSTFETPLRGAFYYELIGTRFALINLEFRFPLIRYLILGWPLPLGFQNIRGVVFMDVGSAWYGHEKWEPIDFSAHRLNPDQATAGYGFGARANMGFFLLKYDMAWKTDFASTVKKPIHYFTLGAEF